MKGRFNSKLLEGRDVGNASDNEADPDTTPEGLLSQVTKKLQEALASLCLQSMVKDDFIHVDLLFVSM